jgi:hypothetical protein
MSNVNQVSQVTDKSKVESSDNLSATLIQRSKGISSQKTDENGSSALTNTQVIKSTLERSLSVKISLSPIISESKVNDLETFKKGVENLSKNNDNGTPKISVKDQIKKFEALTKNPETTQTKLPPKPNNIENSSSKIEEENVEIEVEENSKISETSGKEYSGSKLEKLQKLDQDVSKKQLDSAKGLLKQEKIEESETKLKDQFKSKDKNDLNDLMFSPGKSNLFKDFATKLQSQNMVNFMVEIKDISENSSLSPDQKMAAFNKINDKYIKSGSDQELNLSKEGHVKPFQQAIQDNNYDEALKIMNKIVIHTHNDIHTDFGTNFKLTDTFKNIVKAENTQAQDNIIKELKTPEGLKGKNSIQDYIFNPVKSKGFEDFCKQEYSTENLNFMKDLKNVMNEKDPNKLIQKLKDLDAKYVGSDSKFDLNISGANVKGFKEALKGGDFLTIMNATNKIRSDVQMNLVDTFSRFRFTPAFENNAKKDDNAVFGPIKNLPMDKKLEALNKIIANSDGEIQLKAQKQKSEILVIKETPMIRLDSDLKPDLKHLNGKDFEKAFIGSDGAVMEKFGKADIFASLCKDLNPDQQIAAMQKIIDTSSDGEIKNLAIKKRDEVRVGKVENIFNPDNDLGKLLADPKGKSAFAKFSEKDFSVENIKAHDDLKNIFKNVDKKDGPELMNMLGKFNDSYVKTNSPLEINIQGQQKRDFEDLLSGKINIKSVEGKEVLGRICNDLSMNMVDVQSRFRPVQKFALQMEAIETSKPISPQEEKMKLAQLDNIVKSMTNAKISSDYTGPVLKMIGDKKSEIKERAIETKTLSSLNVSLNGPAFKNDGIAKQLNNPNIEKAFGEFAKKEFSSENINSFQDIKNIVGKKSTIDNPGELKQKAQEFFDKYLDGDKSPEELNVNKKIRDQFKAALDSGNSNDILKAFDDLVPNIVTNMGDTWSRFAVSSQYAEAYNKK